MPAMDKRLINWYLSGVGARWLREESGGAFAGRFLSNTRASSEASAVWLSLAS